MRLSIGFSPCPNDTFMFDALINGRIKHDYDFDLTIADIAELNKMALNSELDVIKVSYHAISQNLEDYQILESGSALGQGVGPLVISKEINHQVVKTDLVGIPGELTTANFLFKFAFPNLINTKTLVFNQIENEVLNGKIDLGVIIHENRFTYLEKGLHKVIDLGQHWEDKTGLPIPLGAIAIRRSLPDNIKKEFQEKLRSSIHYAFDHPDASSDYVSSYAQEMDPMVMKKHITLYVNEYSLNLGEKGKKTVKFFLDLLNEKNNEYPPFLE